MAVAAILWRRLDAPGHDACRVDRDGSGWRLEGTAVFRHDDGEPARFDYGVACDSSWRSLRGEVAGWLGARRVALTIERSPAGVWALDGAAVPGLERCVDLDLGFTPATNLLPLRRLALAEGEAAEAPAVWLDVAGGTLAELPQRYERRGAATYWYEAPTAGYAGLLEVTADGFVRRYPGLWEME